MGVVEILLILFVVLKLVGAITWSWWVVLIPLWLDLLLYLIAAIVLFFGLIAVVIKEVIS